MGYKEIVIGQMYGQLTVLCRAPDRIGPNGHKRKMWTCQCNCDNGTILNVREDSLKNGHTKSCGCSKRNNGGKVTHGMTGTRIHNIWRGIKERCFTPSDSIYKYYGGRGIIMCDEWKNDFLSFYQWAMANGYDDNLTIERINVNGNYEPLNCCWTTEKAQANNKRNNHYIEFNNEVHTLAEWSEITNIPYNTLENRINRIGWSIEKSLTTPVH